MPSYGGTRRPEPGPPPWRAAALVAAAVVAVGGAMLVLRPGQQAPVPTEPGHVRSEIAVLPFENLSAEESQAYFAGGLHDELLTQLSKVAALKVISRTSVMGYRGDDQAAQADRGRAGGGEHRGGERAGGGRPAAGERAADRRGDGRAPLGGALRPDAGRRVRDPERGGAADRGGGRGVADGHRAGAVDRGDPHGECGGLSALPARAEYWLRPGFERRTNGDRRTILRAGA